IGDVLTVECRLTAAQKTPVLVDYILWFAREGGAPRRKVFKLKTATILPGTPLVMTKGHRMKGDATTFRLYPGAHAVEIQVNGQVRARDEFTLQPWGTARRLPRRDRIDMAQTARSGGSARQKGPHSGTPAKPLGHSQSATPVRRQGGGE
ncbi:MAG: hypothetical protein VXW58_13245, partial [Pseudomonadota bacterium]|nr:hypothetical protein [Pseudomonadota bacterium]